MKVQKISNYNKSFGAAYVVEGNFQESKNFLIKASREIPRNNPYMFIKLNYYDDSPMLVCTDELSIKKVYESLLSSYLPRVTQRFKLYSTLRLSIDEALKYVFGAEAKNIKQYNIEDILGSNFDFANGDIKEE